MWILQDHCGYAHNSWEDWGYIHFMVCVGLCMYTTTTSIWLFVYICTVYLTGNLIYANLFVKGAHVWWAEAGTLYLSMVSQNQGKKKQ